MSTARALLVRSANTAAFVRAEQVRQVMATPTISRVPNSALGMAVVGGRVVGVVSLGEACGTLLLSEIDGEPVAFSGLRVERVFDFELDGECACVEGERVPELSLRAALARALAEPRP